MSSHYIQFLIALIAALTFFSLVYFYDEKLIFIIIVLLIPFQTIDSRYGSINFVLVVTFWIAVFMKYKTRGVNIIPIPLPVKAAFVLYIFANLVSLAANSSSIYIQNAIYIYNFASNILLVSLVINLVRSENELKKLIYSLGLCNCLVLLYALFEVALGRHGFSMFGIAELSIKESRNEIRLFGPFDAAQAFVGFLVLQSMLSIYCYLLISNTFWKKLFWSSILLFNLAAIIASGTRSGFLSFIIGLVLLAPVFILKIGFGKTLHLLVFGLVFLGISSYTINKYTQFNLLFDRLSGTEIYGIEVDSRKGLIPLYIEKISEKPLFGHRPMFGIDSETMDIQRFSPPHNLYLFICFTNGLFGLLCFLIFLNSIFGRLRKAAKTWNNERFYLKSFPTICKAIFFTFLVQQFFISFARFSLGDYQQYIFLVFGIFCVLPEIANKDFSPEGASSYHRLEKAIPIPK